MKTNKQEVAVVATDANGAPDILVLSVDVSKSEKRAGRHYDMATLMAQESGYSPLAVIDSGDPAWKKLNVGTHLRSNALVATLLGLKELGFGDGSVNDTKDAVQAVQDLYKDVTQRMLVGDLEMAALL